MKAPFAFLIIFIAGCVTTVDQPNEEDKNYLRIESRACYFGEYNNVDQKLRIKIDTPSPREVNQIITILDYIGLPQNFSVFRSDDVPNAMATIIDGKRVIVFNRDLMDRIDDIENALYWSSMFVLAHEIGHHLADNISETTNLHQAELEADIFAASMLYKLGADSNQVLKAINSNFITRNEDTETHPSRSRRQDAVKASWLRASRLHYESAIPPPPHDTGYEQSQIADDEEFFYQELFAPSIAEAFGDFNRNEQLIIDSLEGIVLQYTETNSYESDFKDFEARIYLLVTKDNSSTDYYLTNQKLWVNASLSTTRLREIQFRYFMKPGRRVKFSLIHLRPAMYNLLTIKNNPSG